MKTTTKPKKHAEVAKEAQHLIEHIRQSLASRNYPLRNMSKEEVIQAMRRTREKLWEAKLAGRS